MTFILRMVIVIATMWVMTGCGDDAFELAPIDLVNKGEIPIGDEPDDPGKKSGEAPHCEAPHTMYHLNTKMVSFEITSNNSLSFGFDVLKGWFSFFKTRFKAITGRLDLVMDISDALEPNKKIAHGAGAAKMSKREFSFELGIKEIGVNFEHYSKTPVAKLTKKGMQRALANLREDMNQRSEEWSSVVRYAKVEDAQVSVVIGAGAASNLKLGDQLGFYGINHIWSGQPCQSEYLYRDRTSSEPLAMGTVVDIRNHAAMIEISLDDYARARDLKVGDEAVVAQLQDDERNLFQPLIIESVTGGKLKVEDDSEVDITPFLRLQIEGVASDYGFVIFTK